MPAKNKTTVSIPRDLLERLKREAVIQERLARSGYKPHVHPDVYEQGYPLHRVIADLLDDREQHRKRAAKARQRKAADRVVGALTSTAA